MTIILRLEGIDVKAGPEDIRKFFGGLCIPHGGVYIVGGNLREAFIALTTEKDGQLAMRRSGNLLKGSKVTLYISNMTELEHKIKSKLEEKKSPPPPHPVKKPQPVSNANPLPPAACPSDPNTALLSELLVVLKGLQSRQQREYNEVMPTVDCSKVDYTAAVADETSKEAVESRAGYVRLFGLPASVTKQDICHFFRGLLVQEVIINVKLGVSRGCLAKFANYQDGCDALHFNLQRLGSISVEVRGASEKMWLSAVQECDNLSHDFEEMYGISVPPVTQNKNKISPSCVPMNPKEPQHRQISTPTVRAPNGSNKRHSVDRLLLKPRKKPRSDSASRTGLSPITPYCIMVSNLPKTITKTDIKELFGCHTIPHYNIIHLRDNEGQRTEMAFVIFDHAEDYDYALNLNGCHVASQTIDVSSITRERMNAMLASANAELHKQRQNSSKNTVKKPKKGSVMHQHRFGHGKNLAKTKGEQTSRSNDRDVKPKKSPIQSPQVTSNQKLLRKKKRAWVKKWENEQRATEPKLIFNQ
ncbi:RNA binding motif protein 12Ba [Polymixia lowei]